MKLIKVYIFSFGKIKNYEYNFTNGVNTVKENNGWGKSTFATFIKCMFYGLSDSKRAVGENERIKYKPWNSTENFGGYVIFEWSDKEYKIERTFGKKQSEDTVRLFECETGKEYFNTEGLGERIFKIDEEGFLSTTYFSQKDFEIKSNTSLTSKYNEMCEVDDSKAFDKALEVLETKAKRYKYSGGRGLIPETKDAVFVIKEKIERANCSVDTVKKLKDDERAIQEEIEKLKAREKVLKDESEKSVLQESYLINKKNIERINAEISDITGRIEKAEKILNGKNPSASQLDGLKEILDDLKGCESRVDYLEKEIESLKSDMQPDVKSETKKKVIVAVSLAAVFLLGVFLTVKLFDGWIAPLVFVVLWCAVVFFALKGNHQGNNGVYAEMYEKKNSDLSREREYCNNVKCQIERFLSEYAVTDLTDYEESLSEIKFALSILEENANRLEKLKEEKKSIDEKFIQNFVYDENLDAEKIKEELDGIELNIQDAMKRLSVRSASIKWQESEIDSISDLEDKKEELSNKVKEYEKELEILTFTIKYMSEADENLKLKYRKPLEDSLNKYLKNITDKELFASIDTEFKISLEENGFMRESDYYSKGFRNLFDICKRFALTDILFTDEKPFIVMDDPFCNLDDEKTESSLKLVNALAKEYQIIYFTCHKSRAIK